MVVEVTGVEMVKVRVNVTQNDIDMGQPRSVCFCPFSLAIGRRVKKDIYFGVAGPYISYCREDSHPDADPIIENPDRVKEWIHSFDRGEEVSPIRATLEIPKWMLTE